MKWYGSTKDSSTPPSRSPTQGRDSATSTASSHFYRLSTSTLPRNESAGGGTIQTNESEPLLGEQLLLGNDDDGDEPQDIDPNSMFLSGDGDADASTIEKEGSDHEMDTAANANAREKERDVTPRQSGSPRKRLVASPTESASDPHIGLNVITNELDTLAYSRDPDESTLFTHEHDLFSSKKQILSSLDEEGKKLPMMKRLFSKSAVAADPPYLLVLFGLGVGIGLCGIMFLAYAEYNQYERSTLTAEENITSPDRTWHGVPYTKIGRESFGDPVSKFLDVSLFHPSLLNRGHAGLKEGKVSANQNHSAIDDDDDDDGTRRLGSESPKPFFRFPFPTGAFWTNLILLPRNQQQTKSHSSAAQYSYPIVAYPYSFQWSSLGKLQASYSAARRVMKETSIQDAFAPDITLGSKEDIHTRHVVAFDSLSVTLRFYSGDGASSSTNNWETYLVQGSPYITAKYSGLTPVLTALSDFADISCPPLAQGAAPFVQQQPKEGETKLEQEEKHRQLISSSTSSETTSTAGKKLGICGITTGSSKQKKIITGVQFVVTTKEQLTWLVFASEPLTFEFNQGARHTIQSREKFGGVIRLALVPPQSTSTASLSATESSGSIDLATSPGVKRLIYHAGAYPVGGSVSWDFRSGVRSPLASSTTSSKTPSNKGHRRMSSNQLVRKHRKTADTKRTEHNIGRVTFSFDTIHMASGSPTTDVSLLMLALPHHAAAISSAEKLLLYQDDFELVYRSIKGRMVPVIGNTWSYEEDLTFMGFGDEPLPAKMNIAQTSLASSGSSGSAKARIHESTAISTLDQSIRDLLLQTVEADLKTNLPIVSNGAYGFGKQIARMAQLAHIADVVDAANVREVDAAVDRIKSNTKNPSQASPSSSPSMKGPSDMTSSTTGSGTARRGYALLEKYLTMWLVGDSDEKRLLYDAQLGGILSKDGTEDINADFGNARYNDHHFHYGYVLYASAILGRANPKFISQYGPYVDALFYDVAHNSANAKPNNDKEIFFPLARHKSWYDGHSFASGLFPFANGKSQESSSEAVNCYFGAYLWSRVRWAGGNSGDQKMVDYARLLLATEITGAKTYWHMTPSKESSSGGNSTTALANPGNSLLPVPYKSLFRENYMVGNLGMTDVTCTTWFGTENIYVHLINFMPVTAITAELFEKDYVKGERTVLSDSDSVENAWKGYAICNEAIVDPNNAWVGAQNMSSLQLDPGLSKSQVLFWISTREGFSSGTTAELSPQTSDTFIGDSKEDYTSSVSPIDNTPKSKAKSLARCSSHEKCVAESLVGSCCPTSQGVFLRCCS